MMAEIQELMPWLAPLTVMDDIYQVVQSCARDIEIQSARLSHV